MKAKEKNRKLKLILSFFRGSRRYFFGAVCASFVTTLLNAARPQVFRFTIDEVLEGGGFPWLAEHLWFLALVVVVIAVLSGISLYMSRSFTARAGEDFAKNMRDALFAHTQRLPAGWHDRNQTGDIIQRCTSDVEVIRNFVVTQLLEVFRTVFLVAVSFGMMLSMNIELSLVVLLFVPLVVVYSMVFYGLIARRFTAADEAEGELSTVVQENATGVRVVRAFGRERFEMDRFYEKNEAFADLWIRLGTLSGLYWGIGDLITGLQVIAVVVLGAVQAVRGNITVGEFIAFASYNTTLVWPVRGLGRILSDMSKAGVSFERVDYIIRGQEENYGEKAGYDGETGYNGEAGYDGKAGCNGEQVPEHFDICFSGVSFGYKEDQEVVEDISFQVAEGKTLGILGGTGSGKSTILQLLTRLYETDRGRITIGGRDIRNIPLSWLRRNVGMVLQEPFLYSRTIRENIAIARPEASLEEIRAAAAAACVDESVMGFADGYDTLVGERGVTLSGGQRQRVAIARMLLLKPPVMIFDDSLSAVDSRTDAMIRQNLKEQMKDSTVILISHRITTLMAADEILVLDRGRILERGSHSELLEKNGIYRKIYEIQMNVEDRRQMEDENVG